MFSYPTYAYFLNTSLSEGSGSRRCGEGFENGCNNLQRARSLQFSINSKQLIAVIWTLISTAISLSAGLSFGSSIQTSSWQLSLGLFFALLLVMVLPVYLFIALWQIMATE
jgi:hypothetical protein